MLSIEMFLINSDKFTNNVKHKTNKSNRYASLSCKKKESLESKKVFMFINGKILQIYNDISLYYFTVFCCVSINIYIKVIFSATYNTFV